MSQESIAHLVRNYLQSHPTLVHALQRREKTQREVAKIITDELQEQFKKEGRENWPSQGAVAVAITRYLKTLREKQEERLGTRQVQEMLAQSSTSVVDGLKNYRISLYGVDAEQLTEFIQRLYKYFDDEKVFSLSMVKQSLEVYVQKLYEKQVQHLLEELGFTSKVMEDNLSLLKLILPSEAAKIPGILAHVASLLADQAISIYDTLVYHTPENVIVVFVINEANVTRGREVLRRVIQRHQQEMIEKQENL